MKKKHTINPQFNTIKISAKVPQTLKDDFIKICHLNGSTASGEIRNFMIRYINKHKKLLKL